MKHRTKQSPWANNVFNAHSIIENVFVPVMNSEDAAEGKKAFREKRNLQQSTMGV